MKKKNILRISFLPLIVLTILAFADLQQQGGNDKGNKGNKSQGERQDNGKDQENKGSKNAQGNNNNQQGNADRVQPGNRGNGNTQKNRDQQPDHENRSDDKGNSNKMNSNADNGKVKVKDGKEENGRKETIRGWRDGNISWDLNNFANRKRPNDHIKVTVCHHTGNDSSPVTINISENALQAHLNHGDQRGNCTANYSERWTTNYIQSRERVYNVYEQTWETMSYSEALLRYAAEKLLGIKTNLDRDRTRLTAQDVQRREALILDLQNNVNSLQNQLNLTRQRADNVNIIIQL